MGNETMCGAATSAEEELRLVKSHVTSSGMEIQILRQTLEETQAELELKQQALGDALGELGIAFARRVQRGKVLSVAARLVRHER